MITWRFDLNTFNFNSADHFINRLYSWYIDDVFMTSVHIKDIAFIKVEDGDSSWHVYFNHAFLKKIWQGKNLFSINVILSFFVFVISRCYFISSIFKLNHRRPLLSEGFPQGAIIPFLGSPYIRCQPLSSNKFIVRQCTLRLIIVSSVKIFMKKSILNLCYQERTVLTDSTIW